MEKLKYSVLLIPQRVSAKGRTPCHELVCYIWQAARRPTDEGRWIEPLQAYTQEYAIYVVGLIYQDTRSVIKVVRYGLNIQCYPDAHAVELCEKQIARQREHLYEPKPPFWAE